MFIGRRPDGSIYGTWTVRQPDDEFHPGQEEVPDDSPEVLDFLNRPFLPPSASAMLDRQRDEISDEFDSVIQSLPSSQRKPFNLLKKLIKD